MNTTSKTVIFSFVFGVISVPSPAASDDSYMLRASLQPISSAPAVRNGPSPALDSWYRQLLTRPSESQLQAERSGLVRIYDGLTDVQVGQAMDSQFNRIQHMMFVRTIVTDASGLAKSDPETGGVQVEDDGCE